MIYTEQIVIEILKEVTIGISTDIPITLDWSEVYEELRLQSLLPLTYTWAKKHPFFDANIRDEWLKNMASQSFRWVNTMEAQKTLIQLLTDHAYDAAIIKGSASGIYYSVPQLRVSSDIDFLVRWDEYDDIFNLLIEQGYHLIGEKNASKHHVTLEKNKITFELHKRPGGTRIVGEHANMEIVDFFQKGLDQISEVSCGKYNIPVLPDLQTAMVLLLHTAQHLREGLGLRHILDWMMFARTVVDDEFWHSELQAWAQKGNVDTLAMVMTKMCQKYLGLSNEITWCQDADEKVADQLMEYVFHQGDFGVKAGKTDSEVRVLAESQSLGQFWKRLKYSSLYSMPIARKHRILRPIAWSYQLGRYAVKGIRTDRKEHNFLSNLKDANERAKLFENLGIKQDYN